MATNQVTNGVAGLSLKKKRPQRAFHQMAEAPEFPAAVPPNLAGVPVAASPQIASAAAPHTAAAGPAAAPVAPVAAAPSTPAMDVPALRYASQMNYATTPFHTFQLILPPPAVTQIHAVEENLAAPHHARLTLCLIPASELARAATKLPLGLALTPFAAPAPVVDLRDIGGPPRCTRCRTYINPMVQPMAGRFRCNVCGFGSVLPEGYVPDRSRVELRKGVVDFLVPDEYLHKGMAGEELHVVFVVDASSDAVARGGVQHAVAAIREVVAAAPTTQMAIVSYDAAVHFHRVNGEVATVADVADPFVPYNEGLFAPAGDAAWDAVLDHLAGLSLSNYLLPDRALLSALRFAKCALETHGGGRVVATLCGLPASGPGGLTLPDSEKKAYAVGHASWTALTAELVEACVGVDVVALSHSPVALANIAMVCERTGGQAHVRQGGVERLFVRIVTETAAYLAQLKVRCSLGLQVAKYYTVKDDKHEAEDPAISIISTTLSFTVLFNYDGKVDPKADAHFQAAFLYTHADGSRRVRVINLVASVAERLADVYAFADQDLVVQFIARDALTTTQTNDAAQLRALVVSKLAGILAAYAHLMSHPASGLAVPDSLRTLAPHVLGLLKLRAYAPSTHPDVRMAAWSAVRRRDAAWTSLLTYPYVFALHDLPALSCAWVEVPLGEEVFRQFVVPPSIRASAAELQQGGCYLAYDGDMAMVWVSQGVNPNLVNDLLVEGVLAPLDTDILRQVRALVDYLGAPVVVAHQGDPAEAEFFRMLVEDETRDGVWGLQGFLQSVHRDMAKEDKEEDKGSLAQRFGIS